MKNILVLIHDDPGQEARLQAALDVTRAVRGHLTCLDVTAIMPFVGGSSGVSGGATLLELEKAGEGANRARLEPRIGNEDVPSDWIETTDYLEPALEKAAGLADLIVVNTAFGSLPMPDVRHLAARLVVGSGKPILAVPDEARGLEVAGNVLVAWDGSPPAMAAVQAATPLLALAGAVTIIEIDDNSLELPAEEAAAYLSRHAVHPMIDRVRFDPAVEMLQSATESGRFAYLVMGAFSRARFRELMFGGVTRQLLDTSPIPLFLAH